VNCTGSFLEYAINEVEVSAWRVVQKEGSERGFRIPRRVLAVRSFVRWRRVLKCKQHNAATAQQQQITAPTTNANQPTTNANQQRTITNVDVEFVIISL